MRKKVFGMKDRWRRSARSRAGFTIIELLVVMVLIVSLMGLTFLGVEKFRLPGLRHGAMQQMMQVLEEARMSAIESGRRVYVGFADQDDPIPERRRRAYLLFRELTSEELAAMDPPPTGKVYRALGRWETLPEGFYWDLEAPNSLWEHPISKLPTPGLPGNPESLHSIGFGSLGEVVFPQSVVPTIPVVPGKYDPMTDDFRLTPESEGNRFSLQISRLTGRVKRLMAEAPTL